MARDICEGLAAAHERGVIHRDLKPGNVLIDGRGRARITDFGLAVGEQAGTPHAEAGTPAYMAPEQLTGGSASLQSDVYALGLILYEVFTGRRTFDVSSAVELVRRQSAADFLRPTALVRDIDPIIERVIVRCLDPRPERRPQSVAEIVSELPGRDALSAAVAAGETPSPAMVAAAAERGDLPVIAAASLLAVIVALLALFAGLTSRTMLYRLLPVLKSPEVLEEKAREIIASTGQSAPRADSDFHFYVDRDERAYRQSHHIDRPSATSMLFLYRQSPRPMVSQNLERRVVTDDPPLNVSGMADVTLDASGRLVELIIVPGQVHASDAAPRDAGWSALLAAAAIGGVPQPAASRWAAPVDSDRKRAWIVGDTRIEAASYDGKPVWFAVIHPWTRADRMIAAPSSAMSRTATAVGIFFLIALPIVAILLALRNIRRGRIDRRAALRFSTFIFIAVFSAALFRTHHVGAFVFEWMLGSRLIVDSVFWAAISWIAYVAIEPLVRRRWPRVLIGWSRLLQGRVKDPIVGRDLLIGVIGGAIMAIVWQLAALMPGAEALQMTSTPLSGLRHVAFFILFGLAEATLRAIGAVTLLLALHTVVRDLRIAFALALFLLAASFIDDTTGPFAARAAYAAIAAAIVLVTMYRLGLLALSALAFTALVLRNLPITIDPSAWYFGRSALALTLVAAIAAYGFVVSLGGKRWIPELALDA
jgi:serine/threonine-protein kinase